MSQIDTGALNNRQLEALAKQMLAYVLKCRNPAMSSTEINERVSKVTGKGLGNSTLAAVIEDAANGYDFVHQVKSARTQIPAPAPTPVVNVQPMVLEEAKVFTLPTTVKPRTVIKPAPPLLPPETRKLDRVSKEHWQDRNGDIVFSGDEIVHKGENQAHVVVTCKQSTRPDTFGEPICKLDDGRWVYTRDVEVQFED